MNYIESFINIIRGIKIKQKKHILTEYVYRPEVDSISFEDSMAALEKSGWRVVNSGIDNTSPAIVLDILNLARKLEINFLDYEINLDKYHKYFNEIGRAHV